MELTKNNIMKLIKRNCRYYHTATDTYKYGNYYFALADHGKFNVPVFICNDKKTYKLDVSLLEQVFNIR